MNKVVSVGELPMKAGDTWQTSFLVNKVTRTIVDGVELVTRSPQNLTGWDVKSQWRGGDNPNPVEFLTTVDPEAGRITLRATGAQTREMSGRGKFDVEGVAGVGSGEVTTTFFEGTICCSNDVTRRSTT